MVVEGAVPSGTVTFLFTDIEGSTGYWEADRGRMERALVAHDRIVREEVAAREGYVFSTGGDGFGVAFPRAELAVAAAVAVQRRLASDEELEASVPLRVRMGLHTGEAQERDANYFGPVLNRAARVMSQARGGQVLLTATTVDVVEGRLGEGVEFGERRGLELRGVPEAVAAVDLVIDGRRVDGGGGAPSVAGLPTPRTAWFGRVAEVDSVLAALRSERLVTLIGIGGVGKTRLAVEVASRTTDFGDGARFVDLSGLTSGDRVAEAVAGTLGVAIPPGVSPTDAVLAWLRSRSLLLVVDNCEHVLDDVGELVEEILDGAPGTVVLATSREPLLLDGERLVPLGSLPTTGDDGGRGPAVELFVDRVHRVRPDLEGLDGDPAVAEICRRLDGIPLALELAAAKVRSMTPADVLAHLDERFRLLTGGRRGAVERHKTLRAAVAWSYDLLSDPAKAVFDRLSVFSGPFDLADALAVAADEELGEFDVIEALTELTDKSMVVVGAEPPYRFLETLAAFGRENLGDRDQLDVFRERHAEHLALLARQYLATVVSPAELEVTAALRARLPDFRAAVAWLVHAGDIGTAVDLVNNLDWIGLMMGDSQGARLSSELPDVHPSPDPAWLADLLSLRAHHALFFDGDEEASERLAADVLKIAPDDVRTRLLLAHLALMHGRSEELLERAEAASSCALPGNNAVATHMVNLYLASGYLALGRVAALKEAADRHADMAQQSGSRCLLAWSHLFGGRAISDENPDAAKTRFEAALGIGRELRNFFLVAGGERELASLELATKPASAAVSYLRMFSALLEHGAIHNSYYSCRPVTVSLVALGEFEVAAKVVGLVGLAPSRPAEAALFAEVETQLADELGDRLAELKADGAQMHIADLVDLIVERLARHQPTDGELPWLVGG